MPRPASLDPLFRSLRSFKGVGPQLVTVLNRFLAQPDGQDAIALDALMHMPAGAIDRRRMVRLKDSWASGIITVKLHIDRHQPPPRGRPQVPWRVFAHDETGDIQLVFFRARGDWLQKALPVGEERYVSGEIGFFNGEKQMVHPDYIIEPEKLDTLPLVEPVYPLTQGLTGRQLSRLTRAVAETVPPLDEWISPGRLEAHDWPDFRSAMLMVHEPDTPESVDLSGPARMRLAYDEYFASQLALMLVRSALGAPRGVARGFTGAVTSRLEAALPFALTAGQRQAIADVRADLARPERMSRLLQGDVGSGKTVVALMAMAAMAESGAQSALMAPTELLATQHFNTLKPLAEAAGLEIVLLTGKLSAGDRRAAISGIADGGVSIVVGTHALFQSGVEFHDLGLTVVDEQHRFGVHQRLALSAKGRHADLLVMTATPIPRTLVLANFGDMAVSVLREKPGGRQPIDTAAVAMSQYDRVIARLKARVEAGAQAFWVCPLVEESDTMDVVAAEERFAALQGVFGDRVELVHGRQRANVKQAAMDRFVAGDARVLVATTVIEVGVDVPGATIIIIEHAERFGLAQLHQLRGRVGRGAERSACLLLYKEPLGEIARARLDTILSTDDGFVIAERDLELRGQGDVLGTRQSGMPGYRLAIPDVHGQLLEYAHEDAASALRANPGMTGEYGNALRTLFYLFRKDEAIRLIRAG